MSEYLTFEETEVGMSVYWRGLFSADVEEATVTRKTEKRIYLNRACLGSDGGYGGRELYVGLDRRGKFKASLFVSKSVALARSLEMAIIQVDNAEKSLRYAQAQLRNVQAAAALDNALSTEKGATE